MGRLLFFTLFTFYFYYASAQELFMTNNKSNKDQKNVLSNRSFIYNNTDWKDVNGRAIEAHASGMLKVNDTYYWYGGDMGSKTDSSFNKISYSPDLDPKRVKRNFNGYNCYSSKDLVNWKYEGKAMAAPERGGSMVYLNSRPHVIYNSQTKKYVMYHYFCPVYPAALLIASTSDRPTGPFEHTKIIKSVSTLKDAGDLSLFKDEDGTGYLIYADQFYDIYIDKLTPDYLNVTNNPKLILPKRHEAPTMVKYRGKYILAASSADSYGSTETSLIYGESPIGPFSEQVVLEKETNWKGQISDMIVVPNSDVILMLFDQWFVPDYKNIEKSRYLWLPLEFELRKKSAFAKLHYMEIWNPTQPIQH